MPTSSMSNLSGLDPERGKISEEKRQHDLQEVKEAIKFIADVAGGGGVDIWSQEFSRNIVDADWNNREGKWKGAFKAYTGEEKFATEVLVDKRTGQLVHEVKHSSDFYEPEFLTANSDGEGTDVNGNRVTIKKGDYVTQDGRWINPTDREQLLQRQPIWDPTNKQFKTRKVEWKEVVQRTDDFRERFKKDIEPGEYAYKLMLENRWLQARGSSLFHTQRYESELKQLDALEKAKKHYDMLEANTPEDEMYKLMKEDPALMHAMGSEFMQGDMKKPTEIISKHIENLKHTLKHIHEASASADAQARELAETMDEGVTSIKKFAKEKAIESYSELGLAAYQESHTNKNADRAVHVGPEIGWPTGYGGHPEEFIELIKESRKKMAEKLAAEEGMSKEEALNVAKEHIKGTFDTGHMGMWLQHFQKKHPQESEQEKLGRFKNWYMEMVAKMQKEEVIGGVQAVDSAGTAHEHLPAGQGILPVVEAVDYLRSHGFTGFVVSEGHGEEQFGRGRIMLETWRAFGSDIVGSYFEGQRPTRWMDNPEYLGGMNPPPYVLGQYRPTDDWTLWSGVPLE
jgi:hypothetical protein